MVITATNIYGSQDTCISPVLYGFLGPPINLTDGRFAPGTGLSAYTPSFVNNTTRRCYAPSFTVSDCVDKEISVDEFSTSSPLHDYVSLLYHGSILHYHIILDVQCPITNWYYNN